MRVALVSFEFGEYCVRLASGMAQDAEVLLLLSARAAAPHLPKLSSQVHLVPFQRPRYRQPRKQAVLLLRLLNYIKHFQPDVVHFQAEHLWFNLVGLPWLRARYPLTITIHNVVHHIGDKSSQMTSTAVKNYGFRLADQRIVHAEQLKQEAISHLGLPAETLHVMPHIIFRDDIPTDVAEEPHTLLFFGRIWEYKGLDYLIRAEPLISAHVPDLRIIIAGQGEDFARYQAQMVHPERFEVYNSYVSNDERARLFQRASIIVLPYIAASQSGVVPLAYTACKPVIATTVGGLPEVVEDGQTGLLVPPRDEHALAEAVLTLLRNPARRRQMGLNGERKIMREAAPDVVGQQTLAVYKQTIASAQHRLPPRARHPSVVS